MRRVIDAVWLWLRGRMRPGAIEHEINAEFEAHIAMEAERLKAEGIEASRATRQARAHFGNERQYKQACLEALNSRPEFSGWRWQNSKSDLRYAFRSLRRSPGFAVVAILTLAIGVGGTAAMFSVVNRLLLNPLPYPNGDRLAAVWSQNRQQDFTVPPTYPVVEGLRARSSAFAQIEAFDPGEVVLTGAGEAVLLRSVQASHTFLDLLGIAPAIGRWFAVEEDGPAAAPVTVLGHGLWRTRFGGTDDVLGRVIQLNGEPHTVIGVLPPGVGVPEGVDPERDVWQPFEPPPEGRSVNVAVRFAEDATNENAVAELDVLTASLAAETPRWADWDLVLRGASDWLGDGPATGLKVLFGAVGLVLLIACANVANLLLARASHRTREFAVRAALGASRWRLIKQLLAESIVLASAGGLVGLVVAIAMLDVLAAFRPSGWLRALDLVRIDTPIIGLTLALALATTILFGVLPAFHATSGATSDELKASGGHSSARGRRMKAVLIVGEVALSVIVLTGALLLSRTVANLQSVDPGFDTEGLLRVTVRLPEEQYADTASRELFSLRLVEGVRATPGVASAELTSGLPPQSGIRFGTFEREGQPAKEEEERQLFASNSVGAEYFRVTGTPILMGRAFRENEPSESIIINQAMATALWADASPVGSRIAFRTGRWLEVVGVAGDVAAFGFIGENPTPYQTYSPLPRDNNWIVLVARLSGSVESVVPLIRNVAQEIDPNLPLRAVSTIDAVFADSMARPRFNMIVLGAFATTALLLTMVGLYGVIAYLVSQRTREIGIRIALGARRGRVLKLVVSQGLVLAAAGVVLGLIGAYFAVGYMASLLVEVDPRDPFTFAAVSGVFLVVATLASYVPARRAAAVDPLIALRAE